MAPEGFELTLHRSNPKLGWTNMARRTSSSCDDGAGSDAGGKEQAVADSEVEMGGTCPWSGVGQGHRRLAC
jgi:hypothetical protein